VALGNIQIAEGREFEPAELTAIEFVFLRCLRLSKVSVSLLFWFVRKLYYSNMVNLALVQTCTVTQSFGTWSTNI